MISFERTLVALLGGIAVMLLLNNKALKDENTQLKKDVVFAKAVKAYNDAVIKDLNPKLDEIGDKHEEDKSTLDDLPIGDTFTF